MMPIATLLADREVLRLDCIRPARAAITLVGRTLAGRARCPRCHRTSSRVHSRYRRTIADLPWHGVVVKLELYTRRFRCQNTLCTRQIFRERLPSVVAHYARKTVRLVTALELIGFAIGGKQVRALRENSDSPSPLTPCRVECVDLLREGKLYRGSSELTTSPSTAANDTALCSSIWSGDAQLTFCRTEKQRR